MTNQDLPGIFLWGRAVKPVALGYTLLMATLVVVNVEDTGVLGPSRWGDILAVTAGTALVCLIVGWWGRSQVMAEAGLILSATVYVTRAVFVGLTLGPAAQGVWLSAGAAVIAGGSYLLERADAHGHRRGS